MKTYYKKTENPDPLGYVMEGGKERGRTARWLYRMKKRARDKGLEFNLDASDLIIPAVCPIFGTPLAFSTDKFDPNQPSMDRINPKKGYVKGNVCVISLRANKIKSRLDGTNVEHLKALREVLDFFINANEKNGSS